MNDDGAWTANTKGCLRGIIGRTIVGITEKHDSGRGGSCLLVLDDGTGFEFNGAFWRESEEDVKRVLSDRIRELRLLEVDLRDAIGAMGVEP